MAQVQLKAIDDFCKKVAKLLRATDYKLYSRLEEIFVTSDKSPSPDPMHKYLTKLLKLPIQNMLVGKKFHGY